MINQLEISVIIPTLGKAKKLPDLLFSLEQQTADFGFEVILVDNSLDSNVFFELQQMVSRSSLQIKLVVSQKQGVNIARNIGILESKANLLLFIDDDCWFSDKLLLAKHAQFHTKYKEYFAIGGRYALDTSSSFIDSCYHDIQMKWLSEGVINASTGQASYLIGGHFSAKKNILLQQNIQFDPYIKYGGSEVSLFVQANKKGLTSKLENIYLIHSPKLTFKKVCQKVFRQGKGKAYLEDMHEELPQRYTEKMDISIVRNIFIGFLKFVFWFGYYKQKKQIHRFFVFCLTSWFQTLSQKRYELIKKINNRVD